MKPFNWTDCEHPCFVDYEESFGAGDGPDDCDWFDGSDNAHVCDWKQVNGGSWDTCAEGRLSKWCDWLPKGAKNA